MLVIDISVNRKKFIEQIGVVRIPSKTNDGCNEGCTPTDDEVFEYKYGFIIDGKIPDYLGTVEHRYGDCGLQLAATVLGIIASTDSLESVEARKKAREFKEFAELDNLMNMTSEERVKYFSGK